jgi:transcriptional regulator with XRE-family HTH domain
MSKQLIENALAELPDTVGERENFERALKVTEKVVSDEDIADGMGCAVSTVSRWREGMSAPHKVLQSGVLTFLRTLLESRHQSAS